MGLRAIDNLLGLVIGQATFHLMQCKQHWHVVNIVCNFSLLQMGCCGVESYRDFTGASNWPVNFPPYALQTPLACCKTLPSSSDYTCAAFGSATTSINNMYTVITVLCFKFSKQFDLGLPLFVFAILAGKKGSKF